MTPRLLFVHAHPDDESLATGATIAHYASLGADVRVVTCTLGEEGEVIGERYALLAADQAAASAMLVREGVERTRRHG